MRSNGCCLTGREVDPDMGRLLGLGQTSQRRLGRAGQILGLRVLIFLLIPSLLIPPEALGHSTMSLIEIAGKEKEFIFFSERVGTKPH